MPRMAGYGTVGTKTKGAARKTKRAPVPVMGTKSKSKNVMTQGAHPAVKAGAAQKRRGKTTVPSRKRPGGGRGVLSRRGV